jgi:Cytochrome P450
MTNFVPLVLVGQLTSCWKRHGVYLYLLSDYLLEFRALHQTASTLTFAMYMLTQHPDITQRLRDEIFNTVGRGRPTFEQMKEMKYLRAFINGTLNHPFHIFLSE